MPIYEYQCKSCGEKFEARRNISDSDTEIKCPKCGKKEPRRVFSSFSCSISSGGSCAPTTSLGGG
jgi:putative FmdB family regulatory protein